MASVTWAVLSELPRDMHCGAIRVAAWENKPIMIGTEEECGTVLDRLFRQQDEVRCTPPTVLDPFLKALVLATVYTMAKVDVTPL